MPNSALSLEPLSSPSPSPSPEQGEGKVLEPSSAGLESGSELSELTEEEQEAERSKSNLKANTRTSSIHTSTRGRRASRRGRGRKRGSLVPAPMWGWAEAKTVDHLDEDEDEDATLDIPVVSKETVARGASVIPSLSRSARLSGKPRKAGLEDTDMQSESASDDDMDTAQAVIPPINTSRNVHSPNDSNSGSEEDVESEEAEISDEENEASDQGGENDDASEDEIAKDGGVSTMDLELAEEEEIEIAEPPLEDVHPLVPSAASIMARSSIVQDAASPSSSHSSRSRSNSSSTRSASPPLIVNTELVPNTSQSLQSRRSELKSRGSISRVQLTEGDDITSVDVASQLLSIKTKDLDTDMIPEDVDPSAEDIEVDEPPGEDDLEAELESDLQPAHRAEALDVLATIELKFALLRERVYVEKMDILAWEEGLIDDGTHPELLHLQSEMSKRKEKRLDLASHKRAHELINIAERRRADENAVWSWWKLSRDDLQSDMMAETNRKRRKLERERRALERPHPVRRIPNPPMEVPAAPSLTTIAKSYPFGSYLITNDAGRSHTLYPVLRALSPEEVSNDLDLICLTRQPFYEPARPMSAPNGQLPATVDGYDGLNASSNFTKAHPPTSVQLQYVTPTHASTQSLVSVPTQLPPLQSYGSSGTSGSSRPHNVPPPLQTQGTPSSLQPSVHGPSPFPHDQDFIHAGPGVGPVASFIGPASGGGMYTAQHSLPSRRSPSPSQGKGSQWLGPGITGNSTFPLSKGNEWQADSRRSENEEERDKHTKDRKERDQHDNRQKEVYHLPASMPPQSHRHIPAHAHSSSGNSSLSHAHGPHHHHRHHHHIVHHHHGQGSTFSPPNGPTLSPRASRDYETSRPHPSQHVPETVTLSSFKQPHWKTEEHLDSRGDSRNKHHARSTSGPYDERERPTPIPFTLSASQSSLHSPPHALSPPSPRSSWAQPGAEDVYRHSSGAVTYENHVHSPRHGASSSSGSQLGRSQHNRRDSMGLSSPRPRPIPPRSPSSSGPGSFSNTPVSSAGIARSPTRYRDPLGHRERSRSPGHKPYGRASPPLKSVGPGFMGGPGRSTTPGNGRPESPLIALGYGTKERDRMSSVDGTA